VRHFFKFLRDGPKNQRGSKSQRRSNLFKVVREAAAMGRIKQQQKTTSHDVVVTNYDDDLDDVSSSYYSFASDGDSELDDDDDADDDDDDKGTPFNLPTGVPKKKPYSLLIIVLYYFL
jgi:hypothetical protein